MLETNTQAPDFTLTDDKGKQVTLSSFIGSYVLLYFYPKDDTPGCTKEACVITEAYDEFQKRGIVVLGVSKDSPESHAEFKQKYNLPFTLLSDPEEIVINPYGAHNKIFTKRLSYLIDPKGVIAKTYPSVDPATHALEIIKDYDSIIK